LQQIQQLSIEAIQFHTSINDLFAHKKCVARCRFAAERRELLLTMSASHLQRPLEAAMSSSSADRVRQPAERGVPAALLEYLAAMRMGAEAAFECELAGEEIGTRAASEERE
jgi:hypothetical protein